MEINLRLIPPCRLHESAPRNSCTLVATFFSVENKRLPSSGSPPRNQLLDLPRSIDHSRPRQPFNDPCRISANHNTERFQVQCSSSRPSVWNQIETDPSSDFGGSSRICVLFGKIMEELIDLEVIFSWEDNYIWIYIWKICTWRTLYERYMFYFWEILIIDRVIM